MWAVIRDYFYLSTCLNITTDNIGRNNYFLYGSINPILTMAAYTRLSNK